MVLAASSIAQIRVTRAERSASAYVGGITFQDVTAVAGGRVVGFYSRTIAVDYVILNETSGTAAGNANGS